MFAANPPVPVVSEWIGAGKPLPASLYFKDLLNWQGYAHRLRTTGIPDCEAKAVATDHVGNSYVTGLVSGVGSLDPKGVRGVFGPLGSHPDVFVAKYSPRGALLWAKIAHHRTNSAFAAEDVSNIAVDAAGNVAVIGTFSAGRSPSLDFDPARTDDNLSSIGGSRDAFVWKLDTAGNHLFSRRFGGGGDDTGKAIAFDNEGSLYVAGETNSREVEYIGAGGATERSFPTPTGNGQDIWVARLSAATGEVEARVRTYGGTGAETVSDLAPDPTSSAVYITGSFESPSIFFGARRVMRGPGVRDAFVGKMFDGVGDFYWAGRVGGDGKTTIETSAIALEPDGDPVVVGSYSGGEVYLHPDGLSTEAGRATRQPNRGGRDLFVYKMDRVLGDPIRGFSAGGTGDDVATDIAINQADGNFNIVGRFQNSVNFLPYAARPASILTAAGPADSFLWRLTGNARLVSARAYGGAGATTSFNSIALDHRGHTHVAGSIRGLGTVSFNTGARIHNLTPSGSAAEILVAKITN